MELEEELKRGSHLKLARRHRLIIPGQLKGACIWEPKICSPGVTGTVSLRFTTSGFLAEESRIVLTFLPQHGWGIPPSPNVTVIVPAGVLPFCVSSLWNADKNTLEFTTHDGEIESETPIELLVAGITTPECTVGATEIMLMTIEKSVIRNTVPPSTRGGQIIDGPTAISCVKIPPGDIHGNQTWIARDFEPGKTGDVSLEFQITGAIPQDGKLLVELPHGWDMPETPHVAVKIGRNGGPAQPTDARWDIQQRTLEITNTIDRIPMHSKLSFTISSVSNPMQEQLDPQIGRVTTLAPTGGGVIDGPGKLTISRISRLTEEEVKNVFAAFDAVDTDQTGKIDLSLVPQVLQSLSILLEDDDALYKTLVLDALELTIEGEEAGGENGGESPDVVRYVAKDSFLAMFTMLYRPGNKFGQRLRTLSARGEEEAVRELVRRGCNPNGRDGSGWTSLHHAAAYGRVAIIQALSELKQDALEVNAQDNCGWTPLHNAASNGHKDAVVALIKIGAQVSGANHQGRTALHWSATKGYDGIVRALIEHGALPDSADHSWLTPLHTAALHGNVKCIKVLLEMGAASKKLDKLGYDMLHYCSDQDERQEIDGIITRVERLRSSAV